jgi:hypothetical protein
MTKFVDGAVGVGATGPVAYGSEMPQSAAAIPAASTIVLSQIDFGLVTLGTSLPEFGNRTRH